ncbi:MAG: hypothetical protein ACK5YR_19585 [Pirellula sp.]|jgi:hypothetical protein
MKRRQILLNSVCLSLFSFATISQPLDLVISKPVAGKPISCSHDGILRSDASKLRLVEREGMINWSVKLNPGEEVKLVYSYERYVPSY